MTLEIQDSRQVKRATLRAEVWAQFSQVLPVDDRGIIPRITRRDMAISLFRRMWRDAAPELRSQDVMS